MACFTRALTSPGTGNGCFLANLTPRAKRWLRIGALVSVLGSIVAIGAATGVADKITLDGLRTTIVDAGVWGVLLFWLAFAAGVLVQLPGMLFVAAGALAYGEAGGVAIGLVGAVLAVTTSFLLVRGVGGTPLGDTQKPLMKRILARLERRPVSTVAVLRLLFWVAPPLNVALALSGISRRDYVIGSAIGLVLPVTAACLFVDQLQVMLA